MTTLPGEEKNPNIYICLFMIYYSKNVDNICKPVNKIYYRILQSKKHLLEYFELQKVPTIL